MIDSATLRQAWRAWLSAEWVRERPHSPAWMQLSLTFLFNLAIALVLTALAWGFARRVDLAEAFKWNFVIAQCIGFTIHGLFSLGLRLLGPARIEGLNMLQRVLFYAGIPIVGMFIGYGLGLRLLGVDVLRAVLDSPRILASMLLFSLLLSALWYTIMANRARVAELEAERARDQARALALERAALDAQLRSLQAQIEPHFLFNTLANVASLIDAAPDKARAMLERLIELLRASLASSRATRTRLEDELRLVRAYLDILALRMGPRLTYSIELEPGLAGCEVPPLLVQPLVENAIRHGLEPKLTGGRVEVVARVQSGQLEVTVSDDGLGFTPDARAGVGLANLRERLAALYGEAALLRIEDALPGTRVRVSLPLNPGSRA
jgi:signal transduction histidine kinase